MGEEISAYFYYPDEGVLIDEGGFTIFDIFHIVSPSQFLLFVTNKGYMIFRNQYDQLIELYWQDDDEGC